ncbi:MAG TPA: dihydropteroate synthase [Candidatus Hydrogenedentes bacterium]|nr:dihydropteroate synthase [Candidatus Hydrogenedentota bacterium]HPV36609.1 dihydropteroate synthase [Candidatus Hydrogenedentota bacterium]
MTERATERPLVDRLGPGTAVMGIVNVTPDSFFDGGRYATFERAAAHARELAEAGADIIDIGGESSRPGAEPLTPAEELQRVLPVVRAAASLQTPVSIDTYHASTAEACVAAGAAMVNDITALRGDPEMAGLVASSGVDCVLMHMQGDPKTMQSNPSYTDVVDDIRAFFDERMAYAVAQGISERRIWLDPGFGFGKTVAHNLELLRRLGELAALGRPILAGTSNKSMIGAVLNAPVDDRDAGTAATVAVAIANGARAIRVHNVRMMARVARMTDAIYGKYYP